MSDSSIPHTRLWFDALRGFYRHEVPIERLDRVSRWLYAGRLLILVVSAQAAIIAVLLAVPTGKVDWLYVAPLFIGLVIAHAISNLSNDFFGFRRGHDTLESPRARYTIHPLVHQVLTERDMRTAMWILGSIAAAIGAFFILERGFIAAIFFSAGFVILFLYDAAPKSLKQIGLGELACLLVWGPLMVGGGYYCLTGSFSWTPLLVGTPYGLGIAVQLVGKHLDQREFDGAHGLRTLVVLLGEKWSRLLNQSGVVVMYMLVSAMVALRMLTPFALIVFLNAPAAWGLFSACGKPRPEEAPPGYVGWPLWFHRLNLVHNKRFGWLYIAGIAAGVAFALATGHTA